MTRSESKPALMCDPIESNWIASAPRSPEQRDLRMNRYLCLALLDSTSDREHQGPAVATIARLDGSE